MNKVDLVWKIGRPTIGGLTKLGTRLRDYGAERIPLEGGVVLAMNHFSFLDPPAFGFSSPRTIRYMAKSEVHRMPGVGQLVRAFGTFSVRRGQSDREAVRMARQVVRDGEVLGLFVEGTRQRTGVPGQALPGAGMVALQEDAPVVCGAVHGSQHWRPWHPHVVSIAWGRPISFDGLPRNSKGYREASAEIQNEIHSLWRWLVELHEQGRPAAATPP